jgi:hypothetical protein
MYHTRLTFFCQNPVKQVGMKMVDCCECCDGFRDSPTVNVIVAVAIAVLSLVTKQVAAVKAAAGLLS